MNFNAFLWGRFSIGYERILKDRLGVRGTFGQRFISSPSYDLLIISSFSSGFQNLLRTNGVIELHYYLKNNDGFRPYFSLSGGAGNARVVYVDKETRCSDPQEPTSCQQYPVHEWERTVYWYGGIGGGFEVPFGNRFSFSGDLELGVLSPRAEYYDKIEVFRRRFAWFVSTRVDYHF